MIVHQRFQGSGGLSCNTQVNTTNFKDPRIKNPGVFLLVQCNKLRERGPGNALKTCSERAATRMESLLWEEKLDRIKTHLAPLTTLFLSIQDVPGSSPADPLDCLYLSTQIESVF